MDGGSSSGYDAIRFARDATWSSNNHASFYRETKDNQRNETMDRRRVTTVVGHPFTVRKVVGRETNFAQRAGKGNMGEQARVVLTTRKEY